MTNGLLTKENASKYLRAYFEGVLKLYQSGEEYPVSLDDVWRLAYSEKSKAVRALRKSVFVEGVDYYIAQNGEVIQSSDIMIGLNVEYKMTVKCMEFFIARKVREIFEVYRDVFKKVATGEVKVVENKSSKMTSELEILAKSAQALFEQSLRLDKIEKRLDDMEQEREENGRLLLEAQVSSNSVPALTMRKGIIALVNEYSAATNISQQDVWHKVYADLYYKYGKSINNYKRLSDRESKLEIAERNGLLQPIFDIVSDLVSNFRKSA